MFRLRVSDLKYDVDDTLEGMTFEFLKTIGFLGLDNDSISSRKRTEIGINIFSIYNSILSDSKAPLHSLYQIPKF